MDNFVIGGLNVEEDRNSHDMDHDNGLDTACMLVQAILDQVTLNDSPPMNELAFMAFGPNMNGGGMSSTNLTKQQNNVRSPSRKNISKQNNVRSPSRSSNVVSRQQHILPKDQQKQDPMRTFSRGGGLAGSVATATCSTHPDIGSSHVTSPPSSVEGQQHSSFFDMLSLSGGLSSNNLPGKKNVDNLNPVPEEKGLVLTSSPSFDKQTMVSKSNNNNSSQEVSAMGNRSLAALCVRTLDSVGDSFKPQMVVIQNKRQSLQFSPSKWTDRFDKPDIYSPKADSVDVECPPSPPTQPNDSICGCLEPNSSPSEDDPDDNHILTTIAEVSFDSEAVKKNDGITSPPRTPKRIRHKDLYSPAVIGSEQFTPLNPITSAEDPPDSAISALTPFSTSSVAPKDESRITNTLLYDGTKRRIQMFGSEYARHLGQTPFSPKRSKNSKISSLRNKVRSTKSSQSASAAAANSNDEDWSASQQKQDFKVSTPPRSPKLYDNLEDASDAVLAGAITDIVVTHGNDPPPRGFYRISQTGDGAIMESIKRTQSSGLLPGSKKSATVNLNVKKESNWDRAVQRPCVTALAVIFPDRNEFVPPGFCVVRRFRPSGYNLTKSTSNVNSKNDGAASSHGGSVNGRKAKSVQSNDAAETNPRDKNDTSLPANLNFGTAGERVYLCYRRSREGNPITGIIPLQPSKREPIPEGYTVLEHTPRNHVADINFKAGQAIFLAFRQRLANLEPLRPLPMVLSVYYAMLERNEKQARDKNKHPSQRSLRRKKKQALAAYFCTGGTVVPADVGKFHIMDRSTHPLLSPSSVTNRLSLIQASRVKRQSEPKNVASTNTPTSTKGTTDHELLPRQSLTGSPDRGGIPRSTPKHPFDKLDLAKGLLGGGIHSNNKLTSLFDTNASETTRDNRSSIGGDTLSIISDTSSDLAASKNGIESTIPSFDSLSPIQQNSTKQEHPFSNYISPRHGYQHRDQYSEPDSNPPDIGSEDASFSPPDASLSPEEAFSLNTNHKSNQKKSRNVFIHEDTFIQSCFDAMSFIPAIECPSLPKRDDDQSSGASEDDEMEYARMLLQVRVAVLTPILTSCYTHHGGSALIAVEGLSKLINQTAFFQPDVTELSDASGSTRLTLLDLAIQVVCDVATSTSRETYFLSCVDFVRDAIRYSAGNLNTRTIGYVFRFYLFIFYFGASIPTQSSWPNAKVQQNDKSNCFEPTDDYLLKEPKNGKRIYLPGGAPQAAALALKELVTLFLEGMIPGKISSFTAMSQYLVDKEGDLDLSHFVGNVVLSLVDSAVHHVDVANYTQLALHQIHRSGGSELFWHDMMTSCGVGLFPSDELTPQSLRNSYIISFAILASIVKVTSGKVRRVAQSSDLVPRDVSSKLLALELLLHFLVKWRQTVSASETSPADTNEHIPSNRTKEEESKVSPSISTLAYTIRRLVVPCLLSNTGPGLENIRVFRRMMEIISELWFSSHYRNHMKMELGVLMEHFVLKMLRLGPQVLSPKKIRDSGEKSEKGEKVSNEPPSPLLPQQLTILNEIRKWFSPEPKAILELFLNFDKVDASGNEYNFRMMPSTHWKLTQQICGVLCNLVEQCNDIVIEQIKATKTNMTGFGMLNAQSTSSTASTSAASAQISNQEAYQGADLIEMSKVRDGARQLQAKSFDAISRIVRSLMICAAAASGANYERLRRGLGASEDEIHQYSNPGNLESILISATENSSSNIPIQNDAVSVDGSTGSDGKTISTIGNIVGGLKKKSDIAPLLTSFETPTSPKGSSRRHLNLSPARPTINTPSKAQREDGIVEYWQTSIAPERRKKNTMSPSTDLRLKLKQQQQDSTKRPESFKLVRGVPPLSPHPSIPRRINDDGTNSVKGNEETPKNQVPPENEGTALSNHKMEEVLKVAFEIVTTKSLKKGLEYLIACNFLTPSPRDIASFLRLYQTKMDPSILGEYLGEGGKDGADVEYFNLIRFSYVRAISFVGMNVEQGLRHFLTNCGFRLPGEAQRIDRIISTFAQCYWEDNAGDHVRCPFLDQDTVFLISFAIIMLNTDLHKSSIQGPGSSSRKQKQRKKMTKTEFLNNLRDVDNSEDLSRDYLSHIYDSIEAYPIEIHDSDSNSKKKSNKKKTVTFTATNGVVHVRRDLGNDMTALIKSLVKSVKPAQELLRGLAVHEYTYLTIDSINQREGIKKEHYIPEDLIRSAVGSTWHHFHGIINTTLDTAHLDPKGLELCLDVLKYSLCATICLNMSIERKAFATQLVRVKFFRENRGLEEDEEERRMSALERTPSLRSQHAYKNDIWYKRIETAVANSSDSKIGALNLVDEMFNKLHASLQIDSKLNGQMIRVARRIRNGEILLADPIRYFLKEGDLIKKCNRTGRNIKYRFFLFSDMLIYAHKSNVGDYKMHEELPLHLMKILDKSNSGNQSGQKQQRTFYILHPNKSFLILADSTAQKNSWVDGINSAINKEVKRKARLEGARQASAAIDRE